MADASQHIGKYRVLRQLGEGATARVYLCHDDFEDRPVAVKLIRENILSDPALGRSYSRLFMAEASLVGKLKHPHIAEIIDAVANEEHHYLVMEYVPGTTMRRYCTPDRLLPLDTLLELMFKCAMALDYVARHGVIHRDLKPANVLAVTEGDQVVDVKLTDFGSALVHNGDATQVQRVGSLAYMAPEQLEGNDLDPRSDIYALGVLMYQLITGRVPFEAPHDSALVYQILHGEVRPPSAFRKDCATTVDALVLRAMSRRREDRHPDWDAFIAELQSLLASPAVAQAADFHTVRDSERFKLLRSLRFFSGFDDLALWEVVRSGEWRRYMPEEALFRTGMQGQDFHLITEGEVEVVREGRSVARMGTGQCVGEMAYLAPDTSRRTRTVDVIPTRATTTVAFTPDSLRQTSMACQRAFDAAFIRLLVDRLTAQAGRSADQPAAGHALS